MIHVIARAKMKPGCTEAYLEVLRGIVPAVLAEEGCLRYEPCVDQVKEDQPAEGEFVTIVECWESVEALKAHLATAHMAEFRKAAASLRESSDVKVLLPALPQA